MARQPPPCRKPALLLSLSRLYFLLCCSQARQDAGAPLKARIAALSQQLRVAHRELQVAEQRAEASDGELQQARLRAARAENLVARAEERRAAAEQECSRLQGASGKLQQQVGSWESVQSCLWMYLPVQHAVYIFNLDGHGIKIIITVGCRGIQRYSWAG